MLRSARSLASSTSALEDDDQVTARTRDVPRWFVAQVKTHQDRVAEVNLRRQGFEVFNPKMVKTFKSVKKPRVVRPVFPGYIFIRFSLFRERWASIKYTYGVRKLLGNDVGIPIPVPDAAMHALKSRCKEDIMEFQTTDLVIGQPVRLTNCAFEDQVAIIHSLDDKDRVSVLISFLGANKVVRVSSQHIGLVS